MAKRAPQLTTARNQHIRQRFRQIRKKHPQWMLSAIIDTVAAEFYLSPVTVAKVLKETDEDSPAHTTIYRQRVANEPVILFKMAV
jgi:AraC-like DNA-binding protein